MGNIGSYSGVLGASTGSAQPMLQVWAKWVNAHGGLSGHPVQVISADDGGNPSNSLSLTESMVQQDHVVAFLNNEVPLTASASVDYLQQKGIPVVGGDLSSPTWNQSPILFPQGTGFNTLFGGIATIRKLTSQTKIGLLYCVEDPSCGAAYTQMFTDGEGKAAGFDPVYSAQISLTQPDFTEECEQAQSAGVAILAVAADADSIVRIADDCAQLNFHPLYATGGLTAADDLKSDPNLNGLVAILTDFPWFSDGTSVSASYLQAIQEYDPGLGTSAATSQMWASGALLAQAIANLNGAAPTSATIIVGLDAVKNNDLGGLAPPLSFTAGQPTPSNPCYFAAQISNGAWSVPEGAGPLC